MHGAQRRVSGSAETSSSRTCLQSKLFARRGDMHPLRLQSQYSQATEFNRTRADQSGQGNYSWTA